MKETLPKSGWFFMNKIVRSANQPRNWPKSASAIRVGYIQTTLHILHTYWSCLRQAIQDVR
jgi:hypothetical protein